MNDPFVPLNKNYTSGPNRTDFRVSIVSQPENLPAFQSLGHGGGRGGAGGQCEPRVTLQRDGERVSSIRIQCSCGQVIELGCVYSNPPNT